MDKDSAKLIGPLLPEDYTYDEIKKAILEEFNDVNSLTKQIDSFMSIYFKENESISHFEIDSILKANA